MNRTIGGLIGLAALLTVAACTPSTQPTPPTPAATSVTPSAATPSATPSVTTPDATVSTQAATRMVVVYFGNTVLDPEADCSKVWGAARTH